MSGQNAIKQSALDRRLKLACLLADKARLTSLPVFKQSMSYHNKKAGHNKETSYNKKSGEFFDPVTQTDTAVETLMRKEINSVFPDDGIIGEEYGEEYGNSGWSWCIDPIDGTRAFIAGVPVWSSLIAINYQNKPVIGIVDLPALGERYIGVPNKAWREDNNGKTLLNTKPCKTLNQAVLSCTEPMAMFSPGQRGAYEIIRRAVRFTRLGLDAYGLALTSMGRIDIVLEAGLKPYDIQAHIPIITGAGGAITGWHGEDAKNGGAIVCVGDQALLDELYPYLRRALD